MEMNACQTCGHPVYDAETCVNCWEVEKRLAQYLQPVKGRDIARLALIRADRDAQEKADDAQIVEAFSRRPN